MNKYEGKADPYGSVNHDNSQPIQTNLASVQSSFLMIRTNESKATRLLPY